MKLTPKILANNLKMQIMKKVYFAGLLLLLFVSCNSLKFKKLDWDYRQDLIGNIKKIEMTLVYYPIDTVSMKHNSVVYYDQNNRIIRQIDYYKGLSTEMDLFYKNNLLIQTIRKSEKNIFKEEFKYDNKNNIIEHNQLQNDTLETIETSVYDKRNNPIEHVYFHPDNNYKSLNLTQKITYDYKNRTSSILRFDENNKPGNQYGKYYYDSKGFIIKTESVFTDSKKGISSVTTMEYDKLGNLIRKITYDKDGKETASSDYKNVYDKKGNIIIREVYEKERLREITTYKISYR